MCQGCHQEKPVSRGLYHNASSITMAVSSTHVPQVKIDKGELQDSDPWSSKNQSQAITTICLTIIYNCTLSYSSIYIHVYVYICLVSPTTIAHILTCMYNTT